MAFQIIGIFRWSGPYAHVWMLHLASGFRSTFVQVPLFAVQCKKREAVSFYSRAFSANFLSQYFSVAGGSKYVIQGETYVLVKLVVQYYQ